MTILEWMLVIILAPIAATSLIFSLTFFFMSLYFGFLFAWGVIKTLLKRPTVNRQPINAMSRTNEKV